MRVWLQRVFVALLLPSVAAVAVLAVRTLIAERAVARAQELPLDSEGGIARLRTALRARPDDAAAWRMLASRLAIASPQAAFAAARRSVDLDAQDWQNWHELGLVELQLGNESAARQAMLQEARTSRGFAAHFQLASLARIQGDDRLFWEQMRAAWDIAGPGDSAFLLQATLSAAHGDPMRIAALTPAGHPAMMTRSIGFLIESHYYEAAVAALGRMKCVLGMRAPCRRAADTVANGLAHAAFAGATGPQAVRWAGEAVAVWNAAVREVNLGGQITGGSEQLLPFRESWLGPAFAWAAPPLRYVAVAPRSPAGDIGPVLRVRFDGMQAERVELTRSFLPVSSGRYQIRFKSGWVQGVHTAGVRLEIRLEPGPPLEVDPISLESGEDSSTFPFTVPEGRGLVELTLAYQRPSGAVRMDGVGWIGPVALERAGP